MAILVILGCFLGFELCVGMYCDDFEFIFCGVMLILLLLVSWKSVKLTLNSFVRVRLECGMGYKFNLLFNFQKCDQRFCACEIGVWYGIKC